MNNKNTKIKTQLNQKFRFPISVNARRFAGSPVIYSSFFDENTKNQIEHFIDQETANGGSMTPFNIQCNCCGACAIRTIVSDGDQTIVVFSDGDRVVLKRHEGDKEDLVTAILWALGQKVFGKNLVRQIHNAIKYRLVDATAKHAAREKAKAEKKISEANAPA